MVYFPTCHLAFYGESSPHNLCLPLLPPLPFPPLVSTKHSPHSSALLSSVVGLVRSSGMFGPTLGFLLGSFCASLWVDIGVVDIGKKW